MALRRSDARAACTPDLAPAPGGMHHARRTEGTQTMKTHLLAAAMVAALSAPACAAPPAPELFDTTEGNLLVVLRETPGANKQQEGLEPFGPISARLPDGREIAFEPSWYQYLGDMHLRLVFDGHQQVQSAVPQDLQRLALSPEQALERAVGNLRQRYGEPVAEPWTGGLMQVRAQAPDLVSSYFLDRAFWAEQLRQHPQGVVAAVPRRGGLVFAPVDDERALTSLRFSAAALYAGSHRSRLSSALYLFKDGRWSVFQPAQAPAE